MLNYNAVMGHSLKTIFDDFSLKNHINILTDLYPVLSFLEDTKTHAIIVYTPDKIAILLADKNNVIQEGLSKQFMHMLQYNKIRFKVMMTPVTDGHRTYMTKLVSKRDVSYYMGEINISMMQVNQVITRNVDFKSFLKNLSKA